MYLRSIYGKSERMGELPETLKPYFQEYSFEELNIGEDVDVIIGRVLEYGNRDELKWLFNTYPIEEIRNFVEERGYRSLSSRTFNFWRIVLEIEKYKREPWMDKETYWGY